MSDRIGTDERFGGKRAVVIGASMAGLVAARVLADHFDEVVVIERDHLSTDPEERKGTPQARHTHGLLAKGLEILLELFPGIDEELQRDGAIRSDFAADFKWHHFGVWKTRFQSGITALFQSRAFLEAHIRRRLVAVPGVQLRDQHDVKALLPGPNGVGGVRVAARDGSGAEEELRADLVVDASGRGSHAPKWLEQMGYSKPEETTVKIHVGYATRLYRRPNPSPYPWTSLYLLGEPPNDKAIGAIFPIEGDRWVVTVSGMLKDYPPSDEAGFLEHMRRLSTDDMYQVLKDAEPLSDISTYRFPSYLRRRYERMERFPDGFVVLGDSLCSFNPIYGQGMTTGALGAMTLDGCLRERRRERGRPDMQGLSAEFQRRVSKVIDVPWLLATSEDLRFPDVEGERSPLLPFMSWYVGHVHRLTGRDEDVTERFYRVMHMLAQPDLLFRPRVVLAVLKEQVASLFRDHPPAKGAA